MGYRSMICGIVFATAVWAQRPSADELKAYLGLTDSQVQALQQIRQQQAEATRAVRQEMQQKQRTLHEQLQAGSTNATALASFWSTFRTCENASRIRPKPTAIRPRIN